MDIQKMKDLLREKYGINSVEELDKAMAESPGVNLGIFTGAIPGKEIGNDGEKIFTA